MNPEALKKLGEAASALAALIFEAVGEPEAKAALKVMSTSPEAAASGLIGYEGLAQAFAIDGRAMSYRQAQAFASKHRRVLKKIKIGHKTVGFRPADIDRLKATLAEDRL